MHCHTCHAAVTLARRVKLREVDDADPEVRPPYAVAFVCQPCYALLYTSDGVGLIDEKMYQLAGPSRFGRAPLFSQEMADDFLQSGALKLTADAS